MLRGLPRRLYPPMLFTGISSAWLAQLISTCCSVHSAQSVELKTMYLICCHLFGRIPVITRASVSRLWAEPLGGASVCRLRIGARTEAEWRDRYFGYLGKIALR